MDRPAETPFDSIENAHDYVRLLIDAVVEARRDIEPDIATAAESKMTRRVEALRLVQHKLDRLEQHLKACGRVLNDLRSLRRLLLEERAEPAATREERSSE
jgi:hypothetical protein